MRESTPIMINSQSNPTQGVFWRLLLGLFLGVLLLNIGIFVLLDQFPKAMGTMDQPPLGIPGGRLENRVVPASAPARSDASGEDSLSGSDPKSPPPRGLQPAAPGLAQCLAEHFLPNRRGKWGCEHAERLHQAQADCSGCSQEQESLYRCLVSEQDKTGACNLMVKTTEDGCLSADILRLCKPLPASANPAVKSSNEPAATRDAPGSRPKGHQGKNQ